MSSVARKMLFGLCLLSSLAAAAQVREVKFDPELELERIEQTKEKQREAQQEERERIEKILARQQAENRQEAVELTTVYEASEGMRAIGNRLEEQAARSVIRLLDASEPAAKARFKELLLPVLDDLVKTRKRRERFDAYLSGRLGGESSDQPAPVPAAPVTAPVTQDTPTEDTPTRDTPTPAGPIPGLRLPRTEELETYRQALAIHEVLGKLRQADIERDTAPGLDPAQAPTVTEGLLRELEQRYDGAAEREGVDSALRRARDREHRLLEEAEALERRILDHNAREPRAPSPPSVPSVVDESELDHWQGVVRDYEQRADRWSRTVAAPYNREADELDREQTRLARELEEVRRQIQELRRRR